MQRTFEAFAGRMTRTLSIFQDVETEINVIRGDAPPRINSQLSKYVLFADLQLTCSAKVARLCGLS